MREKRIITPVRNTISEAVPVAMGIGAGVSGLLFAGAMTAPAEDNISKGFKIATGSAMALLGLGAVALSQVNASRRTILQEEIAEVRLRLAAQA